MVMLMVGFIGVCVNSLKVSVCSVLLVRIVIVLLNMMW